MKPRYCSEAFSEAIFLRSQITVPAPINYPSPTSSKTARVADIRRGQGDSYPYHLTSFKRLMQVKTTQMKGAGEGLPLLMTMSLQHLELLIVLFAVVLSL